MTGSASWAMDVILLSTEGIPEERSGEEIHVGIPSGRTLADDGKRA